MATATTTPTPAVMTPATLISVKLFYNDLPSRKFKMPFGDLNQPSLSGSESNLKSNVSRTTSPAVIPLNSSVRFVASSTCHRSTGSNSNASPTALRRTRHSTTGTSRPTSSSFARPRQRVSFESRSLRSPRAPLSSLSGTWLRRRPKPRPSILLRRHQHPQTLAKIAPQHGTTPRIGIPSLRAAPLCNFCLPRGSCFATNAIKRSIMSTITAASAMAATMIYARIASRQSGHAPANHTGLSNALSRTERLSTALPRSSLASPPTPPKWWLLFPRSSPSTCLRCHARQSLCSLLPCVLATVVFQVSKLGFAFTSMPDYS